MIFCPESGLYPDPHSLNLVDPDPHTIKTDPHPWYTCKEISFFTWPLADSAKLSARSVEYFSVLSTINCRCWSSASLCFRSNFCFTLHSNSFCALAQNPLTSRAMLAAIFRKLASRAFSALIVADSLSYRIKHFSLFLFYKLEHFLMLGMQCTFL